MLGARSRNAACRICLRYVRNQRDRINSMFNNSWQPFTLFYSHAIRTTQRPTVPSILVLIAQRNCGMRVVKIAGGGEGL